MGIKGLTKFLSDHAPRAVVQKPLESLTGQVLAIDASLSLYQFMVAIRDADTFGNLTNEAGEATSHIAGMLSRVIRLMENGIKPVYVFDGKPPVMKSGELLKRSTKRAAAEDALEVAKEKGNMVEVKKMSGRTVKVTAQHNEDTKELLGLLGVPVILAPGEAEATCAALCRAGKVDAVATEDADALTFGAPILIRHLTFSDSKNKAKPLLSISLQDALEGLAFTMDQFVEFCILCGCDYCDSIKGVGPPTAYKVLKQHGSLKAVLESMKATVPADFPWQEAKELFLHPDVLAVDEVTFAWAVPQWDALKEFLVNRHSFNPARVDKAIARLDKAKGTSTQKRLENFFIAQPKTSPPPAVPNTDKSVKKRKFSAISKTC